MVIESLIMQIKSVLNIEKTIKQMRDSNVITNKKEFEDKIEKLKSDIEKLKKLKRKSYEDWKLAKIKKDEFILSSKDYEDKIEKCNLQIKDYEERIKSSLKDIKEEYWIEHFRRNKKVKNLTREVIEELIDCIYVHEGGNITIKFKYQDEYERVLNEINNETEETI
jgi:hypothetical protein